jgi:hypothetical protein
LVVEAPRLLHNLTCHIMHVPSAGDLQHWHFRRRGRFGLVAGASSGRCGHARVWLGWAYLAKTVRKSQRGEVNFDPPMIFCACSMQNAPAASEMLPDDFRKNKKFFPQKRVLGAYHRLAVVTSPPCTKT